jgi:hypothetical protein
VQAQEVTVADAQTDILADLNRRLTELVAPTVPPAMLELEQLLEHADRSIQLQAAKAVLELTVGPPGRQARGIEHFMSGSLRLRWEKMLVRALEVRGQRAVIRELRRSGDLSV